MLRPAAALADPRRVRLRARPARLLSRAWPLSRRAAVRHSRRDLLDRLRPRDCRLDRQAGHALEGRLAAARRLRQVRRRHEPSEQPGGANDIPRRTARPGVPASAGVAALPRRARRAGGQFPAGDHHLRRFLRDRRRAAHRTSSARSSPDSAAAAAGMQPGDRICRVAGRRRRPSRTSSIVVVGPAKTVTSMLERGGQVQTMSVTLAADVLDGRIGQAFKRGLLGICPTTEVCRAGGGLRSGSDGGRLHRAPDALDGRRACPARHAARCSPKQLGGPIKIAQIAGQRATQGPLAFVAAARDVLN